MSVNVNSKNSDINNKIKNKAIKDYRDFLDFIPEIIFETNKKGIITFANKIAYKKFGYTKKEVNQGLNSINTLAPFERKKAIKNMTLVMNGEDIGPIEYTALKKDGTTFPTVVHSAPLIVDNKVEGIRGVMIDITNLKWVERKYKTLFESSRDAIMMLSPPKWNFIDGNSSVIKMFKAKNEEEFINCHPWDLSPKYQSDGRLSSDKAKDMIDKAMKKGSNFFEWTHKRLDGNVFPATVLLTRIEIEGKELLQATVRDISSRKKIEFELEKARESLEFKVKQRTSKLNKILGELSDSEKKYRTLFENNIDGIIISDSKGFISSVNSAALQMLGYKKPNELVGKPSLDIYMNTSHRKVIIKKLMKDGFVKNFEMKMKKKDGSTFDALGGAVIIKDDKGNIDRIEGSFIDITDRKKIEKEIIQAKDYLQNVIDSASDIIFTIDDKNFITTWNRSIEILSNFKKREIIGKNYSKLNIIDNKIEFKDYIKNIKSGISDNFDLIVNTKYGLKRIFRIYGSIIGKDDEEKGVLIIGKDVTEDSEIHGKLIFGNSYYVTDKNINSSISIFNNLVNAGIKGLIITRDSSKNIEKNFTTSEVQVLYLNQENIVENNSVKNLETLIEKINKFLSSNPKSVVLFDRVDYLLSNYTFEDLINSIYKINDLISINNGVLLMRINPLIFNNHQLMLIKEELNQLPSKRVEDIELDEPLINILFFVEEQNKHNMLVTYKKISKEFLISKVTTGKRLNILKDKNLIVIKSKGRSKLINLTDKGEELLHKIKVV